MNWLAFFASIIGSLAWPLTVIVVVLIFRQQLVAAARFRNARTGRTAAAKSESAWTSTLWRMPVASVNETEQPEPPPPKS